MTILNIYLLSIFVEKMNINYLISNIIAYIIVIILSYIINLFITFKEKKVGLIDQLIKFLKYLIMKLILLGLDSICLFVLHEKMMINLYICKIILTIIFTLVSYTFSKKIIIGSENNGSNNL